MKRLFSLIFVAVFASLSLTSCASGNSIVPNSHVTIAEVGVLSTLNNDVADSKLNAVSSDLARLTLQDFYELDKSGELVANKAFGSVKVIKQSPFTVTYTFGKSAVWSDGSQMDATDLALAVAAAKNSAFNSTHGKSSLNRAEIVGVPSVGEKSLTIKFPAPVADWKTVLSVAVPAHIVGQAAGFEGTVAVVRANILDAISKSDTGLLAKLASSYSASFAPTAPVANFVTNGAYAYESVSATEIKLKAVQDYAGTHSAVAEKINVNIFTDNTSAFKAVSKGVVDVFMPTPTLIEPQSDLVAQSKAIKAGVVNVISLASHSVEQFVINQSRGSLADASYSDPVVAQTLRKAFLNLVPKTRVLDFASLTQTVTRSDSFVYAQGSKNYSAVTSANGSNDYVIQDAEKASELVASLKLETVPTIRVLFDSDSPDAVTEWTLLSSHANETGLRLANVSSPDPSERLAIGGYDVYLGPLPLLGAGSGSVQQLASGPSRILPKAFKALTSEVLSGDSKKLSSAMQALDKKLFELGYGLPLYQLPRFALFNSRVSGVATDPSGSNVTWGYWTWHVSADK